MFVSLANSPKPIVLFCVVQGFVQLRTTLLIASTGICAPNPSLHGRLFGAGFCNRFGSAFGLAHARCSYVRVRTCYDALFRVFPLPTTAGGMIMNILRMVKKNPGSSISTTVNKFGKIAGKLMLLALLISMLWAVRITVATSQKRIVEIFNEDSQRSHARICCVTFVLPFSPRGSFPRYSTNLCFVFVAHRTSLEMGGLHGSCTSNGNVDVRRRAGQ